MDFNRRIKRAEAAGGGRGADCPSFVRSDFKSCEVMHRAHSCGVEMMLHPRTPAGREAPTVIHFYLTPAAVTSLSRRFVQHSLCQNPSCLLCLPLMDEPGRLQLSALNTQ